jgi:hypothetical protein
MSDDHVYINVVGFTYGPQGTTLDLQVQLPAGNPPRVRAMLDALRDAHCAGTPIILTVVPAQ